MGSARLIVAALVAGNAAVGEEVGGQALKDAYDALVARLADRYGAVTSVVALAQNNSRPELLRAAEAALEQSGAAADPVLAAHAVEVNDILADRGGTIPWADDTGELSVSHISHGEDEEETTAAEDAAAEAEEGLPGDEDDLGWGD